MNSRKTVMIPFERYQRLLRNSDRDSKQEEEQISVTTKESNEEPLGNKLSDTASKLSGSKTLDIDKADTEKDSVALPKRKETVIIPPGIPDRTKKRKSTKPRDVTVPLKKGKRDPITPQRGRGAVAVAASTSKTKWISL
ncbi:unnamed protein product [Owenia fusiformis]|uniref:Uncharacterized protein n=1 Tax=Owenia fusiformis TaxID=6347 RepID=A0A8S4NMV3_OWEFU|nr:unnamed protein product [Owenia fusiformis]